MAELPEGNHIWGIEDPLRYDGIFCYEDKNSGQRYSTRAHIPIDIDEMCRYGEIYKVRIVKDGKGQFDYHYQILSSRPDRDEGDEQ